jgi:hypothetical protein
MTEPLQSGAETLPSKVRFHTNKCEIGEHLTRCPNKLKSLHANGRSRISPAASVLISVALSVLAASRSRQRIRAAAFKVELAGGLAHRKEKAACCAAPWIFASLADAYARRTLGIERRR